MQAAEDSLKKSVSLFDFQIEKALKLDSEHAGNLNGSKARSLAYLGVVYLRGRTPEALKTAEISYNTATQPHVPSTFLSEIGEIGLTIAQESGDEKAIALWLRRNPQQN
jgi:ATP/maltotriose-dependent transcriptional regulator MalT